MLWRTTSYSRAADFCSWSIIQPQSPLVGMGRIPESSLSALSSLVTLEQLHITSGNQMGRKHDWFVDHDIIRSNLSPLQKTQATRPYQGYLPGRQ
jgi:hypothetical protein